MRWAILDTNVYIGHWERGLYQAELETIRRSYIVRHCSVVLSELRRGARTRAAQRLVDSLRRLPSVQWGPSDADWWEAGRLIRKIGDAQGWEASKRRDFQNDALIALTARRQGATVITANRADFELLAAEIKVPLHVL
ncbi:type II toxin-antitoxin system VapC family toxin [Sorangium sp. So ce1036]|uniref:type II toxin-antitoxin system VapC family toxin n=1 Tax=Sorangium sp. So ce1036 TaxID=3133328 RepID=UPI003F093A40